MEIIGQFYLWQIRPARSKIPDDSTKNFDKRGLLKCVINADRHEVCRQIGIRVMQQKCSDQSVKFVARVTINLGTTLLTFVLRMTISVTR